MSTRGPIEASLGKWATLACNRSNLSALLIPPEPLAEFAQPNAKIKQAKRAKHALGFHSTQTCRETTLIIDTREDSTVKHSDLQLLFPSKTAFNLTPIAPGSGPGGILTY